MSKKAVAQQEPKYLLVHTMIPAICSDDFNCTTDSRRNDASSADHTMPMQINCLNDLPFTTDYRHNHISISTSRSFRPEASSASTAFSAEKEIRKMLTMVQTSKKSTTSIETFVAVEPINLPPPIRFNRLHKPKLDSK